jgi:hypothetical protein
MMKARKKIFNKNQIDILMVKTAHSFVYGCIWYLHTLVTLVVVLYVSLLDWVSPGYGMQYPESCSGRLDTMESLTEDCQGECETLHIYQLTRTFSSIGYLANVKCRNIATKHFIFTLFNSFLVIFFKQEGRITLIFSGFFSQR